MNPLLLLLSVLVGLSTMMPFFVSNSEKWKHNTQRQKEIERKRPKHTQLHSHTVVETFTRYLNYRKCTHTHEVKAIFLFGSKQLLILLTEIIGSNCRQIPDIYRCLIITLRFDQNQFDSEGILKKKSSSRKLPNFLLHSPRTAYQLKTDFAIGIKNYLFTWQNSKFHWARRCALILCFLWAEDDWVWLKCALTLTIQVEWW